MTPTKYFSLRNIVSSKFIRQMIHLIFFKNFNLSNPSPGEKEKHSCVSESEAGMFSRTCLHTNNALSLRLGPTRASQVPISARKCLTFSSGNATPV